MPDDGNNTTPRAAGGRKSSLATGQRVFDRYYLKRLLGQGGMGAVWLAHDRLLEHPVALKFLAEHLLHNHHEIQRLKRETRRNLKLSHANIVRIHDFEQSADAAAITMEYVDGWSLWTMKVDKPRQIFDAVEITPWLRDLCHALDYAHNEVQIVHRDLKPANLLINSRGQIKITDFGLSGDIRPAAGSDPAHPHIVGTDFYMCPQQWTGEPPAVTDDVYSLGVTIYELLTGNPPFYEGDILTQVFEMTPPSMTERLHASGIDDVIIPLAWEETVAACLAKEADRRPVSVRDVAVRLGLIEGPKPSVQPTAPAVAEAESQAQVVQELPKAEVVEPEVAVEPTEPEAAEPTDVAETPEPVAAETSQPEAVQPAETVEQPETTAANETAEPVEAQDVAPEVEAAPPAEIAPATQPAVRSPMLLVGAVVGVVLLGCLLFAARHGAKSGGASVQAPTAPMERGDVWQNSLGMKFVSVPKMPVLFSIWETRVQDFEAFVRETGFDAGRDMFTLARQGGWKQTGHSWRGADFPQSTNWPVIGVTWRDATNFCAWLTARERKLSVLAPSQSYRLPTAAEWMQAAGTATYPWGDQWPPPKGAGNYAGRELRETLPNHRVIEGYEDIFAGTAAVGSFDPNALGIYDLGGNTWEFCDDGPADALDNRWMMGGSWENYTKEALAVSNRARGDGAKRYSHRGFRCVLVLKEESSSATGR